MPKPKDSYSDYLENGTWKCSSSSTGSHSWMIEKRKGELIGKCRYCPETKIFPENPLRFNTKID